jgi:dihydrofolate synthase/folylpolyglutamate synthase
MEVLGATLEAIAHDKAGIMRKGVPAFTAAEGVALRVIKDRATEQKVPLVVLGEKASYRAESLGWNGQRVTTYSEHGPVTAVSPLVGRHQASNLALAILSAQHLGIGREAVEKGIGVHRWPARLERTPYKERWVIFDGAHNSSAAEVLVAAWRDLEGQPPRLVLGLAKDKDVFRILNVFSAFSTQVVATRARTNPRALEPAQIAAYFGTTLVVEDPREALELAIRHSERGEHVLVTGSLFLVAELRAYVLNQQCENFERWQ